MALAGVDTGGLGSYSEETAADPTLIALRDKVEFDFRNGRPNTLADLELVLTDGRSVATSYDSGVPASDVDEQGRAARGEVHVAGGTDSWRRKDARSDRRDRPVRSIVRPARLDAALRRLMEGTRRPSARFLVPQCQETK